MKQFEDMTEPEIRDHLRSLALLVEDHLPTGPGPHGTKLFVLVIFDENKIGQYISNAQRPDVIKAMREFADTMEAKGDVTR